MKFAEKVKRQVEKLGIPKATLARHGSLEPPTLISSYIAKKDVIPRADIALKIARAIGVPVEWLIDDSTDWPPPKPKSKPSLEDVSEHELLVEIAKRHRRGVENTLKALDAAEKMAAENMLGEAPPMELRRFLLDVCGVSRDQHLSAFSPVTFAADNHSAMPGSDRSLSDFDWGRIEGRVKALMANPSFTEAMLRAVKKLPDSQIPRELSAAQMGLLVEESTGEKPDFGSFSASFRTSDPKAWALELGKIARKRKGESNIADGQSAGS